MDPSRWLDTMSTGAPAAIWSAVVSTTATRVTVVMTRRATRPTRAATATGRSRCTKRSKKSRNSTRLSTTRTPATLTPILGTCVPVTWRSSENENVSVPTSTASVAFSSGSRYQIRMYRAEKVPVAIWIASTVTVTTKPARPTEAPTIVVSTVLAVEGAYCHALGTVSDVSACRVSTASSGPSIAPATGPYHKLPLRYSRTRNSTAQDIGGPFTHPVPPPASRTMQRKPRWQVEVSIAWGWRAAGR